MVKSMKVRDVLSVMRYCDQVETVENSKHELNNRRTYHVYDVPEQIASCYVRRIKSVNGLIQVYYVKPSDEWFDDNKECC